MPHIPHKMIRYTVTLFGSPYCTYGSFMRLWREETDCQSLVFDADPERGVLYVEEKNRERFEKLLEHSAKVASYSARKVRR